MRRFESNFKTYEFQVSPRNLHLLEEAYRNRHTGGASLEKTALDMPRHALRRGLETSLTYIGKQINPCTNDGEVWHWALYFKDASKGNYTAILFPWIGHKKIGHLRFGQKITMHTKGKIEDCDVEALVRNFGLSMQIQIPEKHFYGR